jgi:putative oxidoreductase
MSKFFHWLFHPPTNGHPANFLIRLLVGGVFLSEGILKFVYPVQGVGRFTKIGIPFPELNANFVGGLEIVGGICLILGLFTRFFTVPFLIEMIVAILTTKVALYFGTSPLPPPPLPPQVGIWAVLHEIRPDYAQVLGLLFLLIAGPGKWSLDNLLFRQKGQD